MSASSFPRFLVVFGGTCPEATEHGEFLKVLLTYDYYSNLEFWQIVISRTGVTDLLKTRHSNFVGACSDVKPGRVLKFWLKVSSLNVFLLISVEITRLYKLTCWNIHNLSFSRREGGYWFVVMKAPCFALRWDNPFCMRTIGWLSLSVKFRELLNWQLHLFTGAYEQCVWILVWNLPFHLTICDRLEKVNIISMQSIDPNSKELSEG